MYKNKLIRCQKKLKYSFVNGDRQQRQPENSIRNKYHYY